MMVTTTMMTMILMNMMRRTRKAVICDAFGLHILWSSHGAHLGRLGAVLCSCEAVLGALGALLSSHGAFLGSLRAFLPAWDISWGCRGGRLWAAWSRRGVKTAVSPLGPPLGSLGAVLGRPWALLGQLDAVLDASWVFLGPSLGCVGAIVKASWAVRS